MADGAVTHTELQKPEVISQHEEAVRRIIRSSTLEISHHLGHRHGDHHLFQTSTSDGNASVAVSLQDLRPISLSELEMDTVHHGRVLKGTLCVDPFFMLHTIVTVLEDARDSSLAARLAVHNVLEESMTSLFPIGAHVAVKEPFLTRDDDGLIAIRVDNAANVQKLSENGDDDEASGYLLDDDDDDEYDYGRRLRERGNRSVSQGNWREAIDCYSKCLFTMLKEREKDGKSDDSQELHICEDMEQNMLSLDFRRMWCTMAEENKKATHNRCKCSARAERNIGLHVLFNECFRYKLIESLVLMFLLNSPNGQIKMHSSYIVFWNRQYMPMSIQLFQLSGDFDICNPFMQKTIHNSVDCTLSSFWLSRCSSKFLFILLQYNCFQYSKCSGLEAKFVVMVYRNVRDVSRNLFVNRAEKRERRISTHQDCDSHKECRLKHKASVSYKHSCQNFNAVKIFAIKLLIIEERSFSESVKVGEYTGYSQTSKKSNDDVVQVSSTIDLPLSFNEIIATYMFMNYPGLQSDLSQERCDLQGPVEALQPLKLLSYSYITNVSIDWKLCISVTSPARHSGRLFKQLQVKCLETQTYLPSLVLFGISEMSLPQLSVTKSLLAEVITVSVYMSLTICNMVSEWLMKNFVFCCRKCCRQCSFSSGPSERILYIIV